MLHFKSRQHICAFYFSAAEGDDLSCHVAEQFNNGSIIIFQETLKTSWTGSVKCFSVCAFCVWLSEGNDLIWHISEQQNNNISAWSFLIAGENKRLQAIHLAEGLLWHRLLRARRGSTEGVGEFRRAAAQTHWQGNISWSCGWLRSRVWVPTYCGLSWWSALQVQDAESFPALHLSEKECVLIVIDGRSSESVVICGVSWESSQDIFIIFVWQFCPYDGTIRKFRGHYFFCQFVRPAWYHHGSKVILSLI